MIKQRGYSLLAIRDNEMEKKLDAAIVESFKDLMALHGELFDFKVNEESENNGRNLHELCINYKLSIYLSNHVLPLLYERGQQYFADIEFNRNGEREKAVIIDGALQVVRPDIIIHNRRDGGEKSNFLVVECKKNGRSRKDYADDATKITGLCHQKVINMNMD
jgi:hypothetical protein